MPFPKQALKTEGLQRVRLGVSGLWSLAILLKIMGLQASKQASWVELRLQDGGNEDVWYQGFRSPRCEGP